MLFVESVVGALKADFVIIGIYVTGCQRMPLGVGYNEFYLRYMACLVSLTTYIDVLERGNEA
jgi:hypothetical protein